MTHAQKKMQELEDAQVTLSIYDEMEKAILNVLHWYMKPKTDEDGLIMYEDGDAIYLPPDENDQYDFKRYIAAMDGVKHFRKLYDKL